MPSLLGELSCLRVANVQKSQYIDFLQNFSDGPLDGWGGAIYNAVYKLSFACSMLGIHGLLMGFESAENVIEVRLILNFVAIRGKLLFLSWTKKFGIL